MKSSYQDKQGKLTPHGLNLKKSILLANIFPTGELFYFFIFIFGLVLPKRIQKIFKKNLSGSGDTWILIFKNRSAKLKTYITNLF